MGEETEALKRTSYAAVFGRGLRIRRAAKRLGQEEVAAKLGVSQPNYSRMEAGDLNIPLEMLRKLATVFETSPAQLVADADANAEALQNVGVHVQTERALKKGNLALVLLGGAALAAVLTAALRSR